ncbi:hypothetical protein MYU51_017421 [Penicillium brevicompactum]
MPASTTEDNSVHLDESSKFGEFTDDRTPEDLQDLGLRSCWVDTAPMPMKALASQYPHFYTPVSGGMGAIFHNQAGDLHTSRMQMDNVDPMSLWNSDPITHSIPAGNYLDQFDSRFTQHLPTTSPFADQISHAPSAIKHIGPVHDSMDKFGDRPPPNEMQVNLPPNMTAFMDFSSQVSIRYGDGEDLRYKVSLLDTIAVANHTTGIPVTYLNKGQTYNLRVVDLKVPVTSTESIRYQTFIHISFEEEKQRSNPSACWQLWKEGRGLNEARQRGGKLLAVEHVDSYLRGDDHHRNRQAHVEYTSFDGFCITWTVNPATGTSDCTIPIRFYFLSTDFSRSKGVKGIPVRLCVKTEMLFPGAASNEIQEPEVCYCRVKLFRDHGAERKLSNDITHLKKTIEKFQLRISQAEAGGGNRKRKRTNQHNKTSKRKRRLSMGSHDGVEQDETTEIMSLVENLQAKLVIMQDMFSSRRSVSILALRGDEKDDPDLYPVLLASGGDLKIQTFGWQQTGDSQSMESGVHFSTSNVETGSSHKHSSPDLKGSQRTTTIERISGGSNESTDLMKAVGIDQNYQPPAEIHPKPGKSILESGLYFLLPTMTVACFYVRFTGDYKHPQDYYRAIYLKKRTVPDLVDQISQIHQIDPTRIVRILQVNKTGRRVIVDNGVVRELPEGQDMVADINETSNPVGKDVNIDGSAVEIILTF